MTLKRKSNTGFSKKCTAELNIYKIALNKGKFVRMEPSGKYSYSHSYQLNG
jgi:hypothetical protein